ncbi:hypothetical protein D3C76_757180 [compost metagenome]
MPGTGGYTKLQGTGLVDGAGEQLVACRLLDRQTFAGDRCLIDARLATEHFAVQPDAFAGANPYQGADGHFPYVDLTPLAIGLLHRGHVRGELHQAADGIACAIQRARFDQLGDGEQHHHHGRFRPLADQHGTGHRDAHQRVDVEVAVLQGDPALLVGAQATAEYRCQCQRSNHPLRRQRGEMDDLRRDGRHARQRQRPPAGLARWRCGASVFTRQRFGLHAQAIDGSLDFASVGQGMAHAEHAVDQVELQLLDTRQLAQFVLDQRLLGRAIHRLDAKPAELRVSAGVFAQLHLGRCRRG